MTGNEYNAPRYIRHCVGVMFIKQVNASFQYFLFSVKLSEHGVENVSKSLHLSYLIF